MKTLMALLVLVLSVALTSCVAIAQSTDSAFITKTYFPAVTLLYAQADDGAMKMRCTATAFEKVDAGYLFASAAHCATEMEENQEREKVENTAYFITPDEASESKTFIRAAVVACGYRTKGDDFCVFYVKTPQVFPVVQMGVDSESVSGEEVVNVASPQGLGKQVFFGRVTMPRLDRAVIVDDINWQHTVLLQLPGTNGGSSGSAVVCVNQHAVCAFLVGIMGGTTVVAIPVSRFKAFLADVKACKAKSYVTDVNAPDSAFSYHCPSMEAKK